MTPSHARLAIAAELQRLREAAGWDVDTLAGALGVTASEVRAWEAGRNRIPIDMLDAARLETHVARSNRVLAESGLPECPWAKNWEAVEIENLDLEQSDERLAALKQHAATCDLCRRRDEYAERHGPPFPQISGPGRMFRIAGAVFDITEKAWRSFGGLGPALIIGGMAAIDFLIYLLPHHDLLYVPLYFLAIATGAAIAIWLYDLTQFLHPLGPIGRWLSRVIAAIPACSAFVLTFHLTGYPLDGDPVTTSRSILIGTIMGVAFATLWGVRTR